MEKLTFGTNWNNKLNSQYFTTIRLSGRFKVDDLVEVEDRGVAKGVYQIIDKRRMDNYTKINDWMAYLDTGYNAEETRKILDNMYKNVNLASQPIYYYLVGKYQKKPSKS